MLTLNVIVLAMDCESASQLGAGRRSLDGGQHQRLPTQGPAWYAASEECQAARESMRLVVAHLKDVQAELDRRIASVGARPDESPPIGGLLEFGQSRFGWRGGTGLPAFSATLRSPATWQAA